MDNLRSIANTISHDELVDITKSTISNLFKSDSLLSDLPSDIILEEILSLVKHETTSCACSGSKCNEFMFLQTALEHGQSITVTIAREDEQPLKVIVPQNSTVRELKKAIARHFEIYQQRTANETKISWKYIWKTYNLNYDSLTLDNDNGNIADYGVINKVILHFKKKRKKPR